MLATKAMHYLEIVVNDYYACDRRPVKCGKLNATRFTRIVLMVLAFGGYTGMTCDDDVC